MGNELRGCATILNKYFLKDMCWVLCQKMGTGSETRHSPGLQPLKGFWLLVLPIKPRLAFLSFLQGVTKGEISAYIIALA